MNKITSLQFLYKHPIWNILFDYQDIKNFYVCGGYIRDYILYGNGGKDIDVFINCTIEELNILITRRGVELWNNDWVNDVYKRTFPQYKICTDWIRDSFTPIIDIDEVSLFDIY